MSTPLPLMQSPDQTLAMIAERAKSAPDADSFTVKIYAKRDTVLAKIHAAFSNVRLAHIASIESWLPKVLGGGEYTFAVSPSNAEHERIGSPIPISIQGPPIEFNFAAMQDVSWDGPTFLKFPMPRHDTQAAPMPTPRPVIAGYQHPTQVSAQSQVAAQAIAQGSPGEVSKMLEISRDVDERRARLQAQELELKLQRERAEIESKHAKEKLEMEAKIAAQAEETRRMVAASQASNKGAGELVAALTAALAPIVTQMITSSTQARIESAKLQAEAAARSEAAAREQAALQRESNQQMMQLILKMGDRPAVSPELTAMLEITKEQSRGQGEMMSRIVDAMGTVSKTSVSMIETIAELSAPPEGSPVLDAVKEGVKALTALTGGAEKGARKVIAAQQALPERTQAIAAQQKTASQRAAQAQPPAQAQTPRPVEVVKFEPSPAPNMPPAVETKGGFNGVDPGVEDGEIPRAFPKNDSVAYIEQLIREKYEPVEYVAKMFVESLTTEEMQQALHENDDDVEKLLAKRLGEWLIDRENFAYVERLAKCLDETGIFEDDAADGAKDVTA